MVSATTRPRTGSNKHKGVSGMRPHVLHYHGMLIELCIAGCQRNFGFALRRNVVNRR